MRSKRREVSEKRFISFSHKKTFLFFFSECNSCEIQFVENDWKTLFVTANMHSTALHLTQRKQFITACCFRDRSADSEIDLDP